MSGEIKITRDLKFNYDDLTKIVDQDCEFTLMDVLEACMNSKIPMEILAQIIDCLYIPDLYNEAKSREFKVGKNICYLCLSLWGTINDYNGKINQGWAWIFDGVGKPGHYGKEIESFIPKSKRAKYIERYAIEFSPVDSLSGYKIKIGSKIHITDYRKEPQDKDSNIYYDFQPSITLIDLLYSIFYELSLCGSIEDREAEKKMIKSRIRKINRARKNGTIDKMTVSWKKGKIGLEKKIKEIKEKNSGM
jgi:hypothetical protein